MKTIGVIPARWASTRFAGKVLAEIAGKPMIQHVWERAKESKKLNDLIIACDEECVLKAAKKFGANAVMTAKTHPSGSDRIAEVVEKISCDIVMNIQGDEPLIHHSVIDSLAEVFESDRNCNMATVIKILDKKEDWNNPNVVKVVIDEKKNALYFSRSPIPYNCDNNIEATSYKHLGIYAYKKDFLFTYKNLPKSSLEKIEQLEQLRVLEAGYKIKTVLTDYETIGVDTPDDLIRVKNIIEKKLVNG